MLLCKSQQLRFKLFAVIATLARGTIKTIFLIDKKPNSES